MNTEHIKRLIDEADRLAAFARNHQLTDMADSLGKHADELRKLADPVRRTFTPAALEGLSYIITTATEGGHYTREDFHEWRDYKHGDTGEGGRFHAEVTVIPNDDLDGIPLDPIRMTPEELGNRLLDAIERNEVEDNGHLKVRPHHALMIMRLVNGDEDVAGEADVIDAGALMQLAVYGEVIYG